MNTSEDCYCIPAMTNETRYSHHARRALTHARLTATEFRHPRVDTGHLLLGVLRAQGSIGYQVLESLGLDAQHAAEHLSTLTLAQEAAPDPLAHDAALDLALELADDEAAWLGHHYIGTHHLLLGMTRTNLGNSSDLLRLMSVSPEKVRSRVRRALNEGMTEFNLEAVRRNPRFSELARRVINAAEQYSLSLDHETIGVGHLLAALAHERRGSIAHILTLNGFDTARLAADLEHHTPALLISSELVFEFSLEAAERHSSHYTGTEHLLLAVLALPDATRLMAQYGVNADSLRQAVREHLKQLR